VTPAEFLLPGEEESRATMERTFSTSLARLDDTLKLGVKLLEKTGEFITTRRRSERSGLVVMGLYMKALKTVRAIRLATTRDLQEDGLVLCRTLLETTVAILYVLQKRTPHRAIEYLAAMLMRKKWTMEDWEKTHGLKHEGKRIHKKIQKQLAPYEKVLGLPRLQELRRGYSGLSIKRTFAAVGLTRLYFTAYAWLSSYQHAADLPDHVELAPDGAIQLKMGSSDVQQTRFLLDLTRSFFCAIMQRTSQEMALGYEAEIDALKPNARDLERLRLQAWKQRMKARRHGSRTSVVR
jgi:hypothetical protein